MAILAYTLLVCTFAGLWWIFSRGNKRTKNGVELPPGPRGLPLIGNMHQIVGKTPEKLSKFANEYGKMFTIYFGSNTPALVVNDVQLMKQVFGTLASTGKLANPLFDVLFDGEYGIINTEGKMWLEQRIFLHNTLKDFGFGNKASSHLESVILAEVNKFAERMKKDMQTKGTVHVSEFIKESAGGTIWALVTGKTMTSEMAQAVDDVVKSVQKVVNSGLLFLPWLRYIAPKWSGYVEGKAVARKFHTLVENTFNEHKKEGNTNEQRDVVSAFIEHTKKMQDNPSSVFFGSVGETHNINTIVGLLVAGVETTATTINWLLFYLCVHPEVQSKLQKEIDGQLEGGRDPKLTDREKMPYTEAVFLETLRMASTIPFGTIHKLTDDITVQGQKFPKGLSLMTNIYHVHQDRSIWGDDADNFRPERFLEDAIEDGGSKGLKIIGNLRDSVVAFQPGRRTCIGEPLARDAIFMFMVKLCKTFNFLPEKGRTKEEYMERHFGIVIQPKNLGIQVVPRNHK